MHVYDPIVVRGTGACECARRPAMARALDDHPLVTSRVDSATLNPAWVRDAHGLPWQAERVLVFYDFLPAAGINVGVARPLFERLGGFPSEFRACEDIAFSWRAQLGEQIRPEFVAAAVYRYRYRDSLFGLFAQNVVWGCASALLYRRFRESGMPGRTVHVAFREWRDVLAALATASGKSARAPVAVRLGSCVGRLAGSVRYGVWFL